MANGICERVHQTILNEFYRVTFRKKVCLDLEARRLDFDEYVNEYNYRKTHQRKRCQGGPQWQPSEKGRSTLRKRTWKIWQPNLTDDSGGTTTVNLSFV